MVRCRRLPIVALAGAAVALVACGAGGTAVTTASAPARSQAREAAMASNLDWPEFGFDEQRSNAASGASGIDAGNVAQLKRRRVALPGTVDSSPIYMHGVDVGGSAHDVFVSTTTYGRTLAIDAASARILWQFAPPGIGAYEGTYQITTATPIADPDRRFVYAASPDGLVHKLSLADGREQSGWPVSVTRDARREKIASALNIAGPALVVVTGGYVGDQPPYQGHVVTIDRASGRLTHVFNTLCANRHQLIVPSSCPASDSAIWARAGAVLEPGGRRLLVATGNAPYDGHANFGDSVLELDASNLHLLAVYTPAEQAALNASDTDLGASAPALLPGRLAVTGGKDGILRLLDLAHLDGRAAPRPFRTGGELQRIAAPGGAMLFSTPAVSGNSVYVASAGGTAAYTLRARRLHLRWSAPGHGSSPILAGGLLYVYDIDAGRLDVYAPASGRLLAHLDAATGHWNSPIVAGGRVALPEGNANDNHTSGTLDIYSLN